MTYWSRVRTQLAVVACILSLFALSAPQVSAQLGAPGGPPASSGDGGDRSGSSTPREDGNDRTRTIQPTSSDIAQFRGRPEFALYGSAQSVAAAEAVLLAAGAQLLRIRPLPALSSELRVYDFQNRIDLDGARALIGQAGSPALVDLNTIYRVAQGASPRLYAASILGDAGGGCRLRSAIAIGMIDSPVATGHPALSASNVTVLSSLLPSDEPVDAGHGTAVAALLVGEDASGSLRGFAPGARLIAVSAFARETGGSGADIDRIAGALDALTRANADVINMSFAGPPNAVFEALLRDTAARGAILVGAAGNTGSNEVLYPAASQVVIAVTAVDAALRRYRTASVGTTVEFAAPGVDVFVADGGAGARYASGTSYAAPIVAAMVARLNARGLRSTDSVRDALRSTSRDLGAPGRDTETGWGLVSAPDC